VFNLRSRARAGDKAPESQLCFFFKLNLSSRASELNLTPATHTRRPDPFVFPELVVLAAVFHAASRQIYNGAGALHNKIMWSINLAPGLTS
jgi:hypothetical protein